MLKTVLTCRPSILTSSIPTCVATFSTKPSKYLEHFQTLGLPVDATKHQVRSKYIDMVKLHHPDTSHTPTDIFMRIDTAYRELQNKFAEDKLREESMVGEYGLYYDENKYKEEEEEYEHPDINHTAPQHRQYLSHDGIGAGNPFQRARQHKAYRVSQVKNAIQEYKIEALTREEDQPVTSLVAREKKAIKKQVVKQHMDRLVEDLIQESISKGEFDNLPLAGKPLPERVEYDPYSDFTTLKMNQIMVEGGFAPEWVMLHKDIANQSEKIRGELRLKWKGLGPLPQSKDNWEKIVKKLADSHVKMLNKDIDKFNLIVPVFTKQMFHFNIKLESEKVLQENCDEEVEEIKAKVIDNDHGKKDSFLSEFIKNIFYFVK